MSKSKDQATVDDNEQETKDAEAIFPKRKGFSAQGGQLSLLQEI